MLNLEPCDSPMRRLLLGLTLSLFAGGSTSCGSILPACTLIGCDSGIEVVLENEPDGAYRIEAFADSDGPRHVYECSSATGCQDRVFFTDFTPVRIFIDVTSANGTERYEVLPKYREHRPNGPNCPPRCRTATIRLPSDRLGG